MIRLIISILLIGAAIGATAFGILGFQGKLSRKPPLELFPDMDRQAKLHPQEPNRFFANGVSSQLPVAGTIARSDYATDPLVHSEFTEQSHRLRLYASRDQAAG